MTPRDTRSSSGSRLGKAAWIVAALLVAAVIYMITAHGHRSSEPAGSSVAAPVVVDVAYAAIRPMDTTVSVQGTLVPAQGASAKIAAVIAGRLLSVTVREGDRVSAGQLVASVDGQVQKSQAVSAAAALRASKFQADQVRLGVEAAVVDQANAVKVASLDLQSAETELRKLRRGARPQEIAQAEQAINQAKATYDRAATELDRVKFLNEKGIVAKRQLDDAVAALAVAKSALETAKDQADLVRAGARSEDLHSAELRVETARANLERARRGSLQIAAKKREAQAAVESVSQKAADLAAAQTTAGYSELRSPIAGIVIHRMLNPGDMADPASPVLEVAGLRTLDLSANVPADEGGAIRVGMPVRVSAVSVPGQTIVGRVLDVGQIDPQTGLLSVRVTVPNPGDLKAGAFATAQVVVHTDPHAIVVPKQAIVSRNGKPTLFVVGRDNVAHERQAITGVENGGMVQIISGVAPGDCVIRLGQYELSDGAKVRASGVERSGR